MSRRRRHGFSVIELMIALAITMILVFGITQLFISAKDGFRTLSALSNLQENARFAIHTLTRDLRHTGLYGCRSGEALFGASQISAFTNTTPGTTFTTDFGQQSLLGFDHVSSAWNPAPVAAPSFGTITPLTANNDMLALRGARDQGTRVDSLMGLTTDPIPVKDVADFAVNDFAVVTDCQAATVMKITSIDTTNKTLTHGVDLTKAFGDSAEVYGVQTVIYFLANATGASTTAPPTLFRKVNDGAPQELIGGVERLQIRYGEDTNIDGTADRFVPAADAALNMGNVVSVRLGMLVRSEDFSTRAARAQTFNLLGANVPFNDRFQRQIVISTIALRNKVL